MCRKNEKHHLRLAFGREGDGGGGSRVKIAKKDHLQLAFGRKGGGGGWHLERMKITTSGSRLDVREVVVVGGVSKERK